MNDPEKIALLCDKGESLTDAGIVFHELDFEGTRAACVNLMRALHSPRGRIVSPDHYLFWSWMSDLLRCYGDDLPDPREADYAEITRLHAAIGKPIPLWFTHDESEIAHLFEIVGSALCAPFGLGLRLPGFQTRDSLVSFVSAPRGHAQKDGVRVFEYDGVTIATWRASRKTYKPGKQCSSLGDLLFVVWDRIAPRDHPELKSDLDEVRSVSPKV